jgi:integrase
MYLEVMPNGSKYWRLKYRYLGKEKRLALGVYPIVTLAEAREKRDDARKLLANDVDPSTAKKQKKREAIRNANNSFEAVAREWHTKKCEKWAEKTGAKIMRYLEKDVFPHMGGRPIGEIDPTEVLDMLRKIEARGAYYNAGRIKPYCGQIFRYGVATGKSERDPTGDLKGALATVKTKHHASLSIKEMPEFLKALELNDARLFPQTRRGIRLLMLTLVRTTELIEAQWDEFDFKKSQWEIPAERMKMDVAHIVPLSKQVLELFKEQQASTAHLNTNFVFPNQVRPKKPMSNNTILMGIKRLGFKGRMTGHGFRALAMTTLMEELDYPFEIPDAQLGHAKGNSVRRAYDRTKYLPQRKKMLQHWSDYLDVIASGDNVVHGKFGKGA